MRVARRHVPGPQAGHIRLASNFSFYYAHHLSTIEGGMVCTNDADFYETVRMLRSPRHGPRAGFREPHGANTADEHPDLNPDFIFALPGYNVRSTEINAVIGRSQLQRLDDSDRVGAPRTCGCSSTTSTRTVYQTDFAIEGSSNYAFTLILKQPDEAAVRTRHGGLRTSGVEFRRGTAGRRQPGPPTVPASLSGRTPGRHYPRADHVHFFGMYIGNYPALWSRDQKSLRLLRRCS